MFTRLGVSKLVQLELGFPLVHVAHWPVPTSPRFPNLVIPVWMLPVAVKDPVGLTIGGLVLPVSGMLAMVMMGYLLVDFSELELSSCLGLEQIRIVIDHSCLVL